MNTTLKLESAIKSLTRLVKPCNVYRRGQRGIGNKTKNVSSLGRTEKDDGDGNKEKKTAPG
jgi:hypothetical protein